MEDITFKELLVYGDGIEGKSTVTIFGNEYEFCRQNHYGYGKLHEGMTLEYSIDEHKIIYSYHYIGEPKVIIRKKDMKKSVYPLNEVWNIRITKYIGESSTKSATKLPKCNHLD
jgi:hypothetical protein